MMRKKVRIYGTANSTARWSRRSGYWEDAGAAERDGEAVKDLEEKLPVAWASRGRNRPARRQEFASRWLHPTRLRRDLRPWPRVHRTAAVHVGTRSRPGATSATKDGRKAQSPPIRTVIAAAARDRARRSTATPRPAGRTGRRRSGRGRPRSRPTARARRGRGRGGDGGHDAKLMLVVRAMRGTSQALRRSGILGEKLGSLVADSSEMTRAARDPSSQTPRDDRPEPVSSGFLVADGPRVTRATRACYGLPVPTNAAANPRPMYAPPDAYRRARSARGLGRSHRAAVRPRAPTRCR